METSASCITHHTEGNHRSKEVSGQLTSDSANKCKQMEGGGVYTRVKLYSPSKRTATKCGEEEGLHIKIEVEMMKDRANTKREWRKWKIQIEEDRWETWKWMDIKDLRKEEIGVEGLEWETCRSKMNLGLKSKGDGDGREGEKQAEETEKRKEEKIKSIGGLLLTMATTKVSDYKF